MGEIADEMVSRMLGEGPRVRRTHNPAMDLTKIHYHKVKDETEKALLIDVKNLGEVWVPKSIIMSRSAKTAFVRTNIWRDIVANSRSVTGLLPDLPDEDESDGC